MRYGENVSSEITSRQNLNLKTQISKTHNNLSCQNQKFLPYFTIILFYYTIFILCDHLKKRCWSRLQATEGKAVISFKKNELLRKT